MNEDLADVVVEHGPEQTVIAIRGEVDLSNADDVQRRIAGALDDRRLLVVDLTDLVYMDSRGVRLLYELARTRPAPGFAVVAPAASVAGQVLAITQFTDLVPVFETVPGRGA